MPYERPGAGVYVTATKVTEHNAACSESGYVGVAVKQKAESWTAGYTSVKTIAIGERFHIRTKGEKQVPNKRTTAPIYDLSGAALGTGVYINPTTNVLTTTGPASGTALPYGRISGVAGDAQGCPTGFMRIDLDQKDTLA